MKILFGMVLSSWRHRLTAEFDAADGWLRQELAVLNRFTLLGVPVTKVVGEVCPGARAGPPSVDFSNGAFASTNVNCGTIQLAGVIRRAERAVTARMVK